MGNTELDPDHSDFRRVYGELNKSIDAGEARAFLLIWAPCIPTRSTGHYEDIAGRRVSRILGQTPPTISGDLGLGHCSISM